MNVNSLFTVNAAAALLLFGAVATADAFDITWYTIDGGGGYSAGGDFELEGTIGQPDAGGPLSGGDFDLTGGFWTGAVPACACLGDMNGDGDRNGADIAQFVSCILVGGSCACADVDGMTGVTIDDIPAFVASLLAGTGCP